jgi:mono/diheme cytochrome c family protein
MPEPPEVDGALAFAADCASCHGPGGQGDGVLAAGLDPKPANLTTIAARNGGVFPRDQVMSVIDGLARGQHRTSAMPEFGAGDMGETIIVETDEGLGTPVPARLLALTDYVESLQVP